MYSQISRRINLTMDLSHAVITLLIPFINTGNIVLVQLNIFWDY